MHTLQLLKDLVYKEYKQNSNITFNCVHIEAGQTDNRPFFHYENEQGNIYYNLYAGFEPVLEYIAAKIDNRKVNIIGNEKLIADKIYDDVMCIYNGYREENYYI